MPAEMYNLTHVNKGNKPAAMNPEENSINYYPVSFGELWVSFTGLKCLFMCLSLVYMPLGTNVWHLVTWDSLSLPVGNIIGKISYLAEALLFCIWLHPWIPPKLQR